MSKRQAQFAPQTAYQKQQKRQKFSASSKFTKPYQHKNAETAPEIVDSAWKTVLATPRDEGNEICDLDFGVKVVVGSDAITAAAISFIVYIVKSDSTYELRLRRNEAKWLVHALGHPDGVQTFYKVPMRQLESRFMDDQDLLRLQLTDDKNNVFKLYCSISSAEHLAKKIKSVLEVTEFDWKSYYDRDIYLAATLIKQENASFGELELDQVGSLLGLISPQYVQGFSNLEHEAERIVTLETNATAAFAAIKPREESLLNLMVEVNQ